MNQFTDFGLPAFIIESLERMKITTPTPVQKQSIPVAMTGKDILASAQTGTGKTIAYLLPAIAQLSNTAHGSALVLAPTRELADQIKNALLELLGRKHHRDIALLIGGAPIYKQFMALKSLPRFIIGTPGRIIDHLERRSLSLEHTKFLILDETDRMLDMGFSDDLERIAQELPKERQTMMFSATMPANIIKLSQKYLNNPEHIKIGEVTKAAAKIDQKTLKATGKEKFPKLLEELEAREGSVIIFVRTKISAAELAEKLNRHDHRADAIHGDLRQRQRDEVIRNYRNQKNRILVATDIAARGLDIPHIMHVINYDLPQCPEDYIHRIGRTGRAGMEGFALSFVAPSETRKWQMIYQHVNHGKTTEQPQFNARKGRRPSNGNGGRSFGRGSEGGERRSRSDSGERRHFGETRRGPSEGGEKRFGDRRHSEGEGAQKKRSFGDRRRTEGEGGQNKRSFGDRRQTQGENGQNKRSFSERPQREGSERKRFGDKPSRSTEGGSEKKNTWNKKRPSKESSSPKREYISEGASNPFKKKGSSSKANGKSKQKDSTMVHEV